MPQNPAMIEKPDTSSFKGLLAWATTRPQGYAVYFICVVLIGGLSFFVGRFNPKHPPPASSVVEAPAPSTAVVVPTR